MPYRSEYCVCAILQAVYRLYNITEEPFLFDLGDLLHKRGINFTDMMLNRDDLSRLITLHCINLAHGIKEPVIRFQHRPEQQNILTR